MLTPKEFRAWCASLQLTISNCKHYWETLQKSDRPRLPLEQAAKPSLSHSPNRRYRPATRADQRTRDRAFTTPRSCGRNAADRAYGQMLV
jgi:hypothetical protein